MDEVLISVVVPVYNEEESIPIFYETVRSYMPLSDYDIEKSVCLLGFIDADGQEEYMRPNSWDEIQEMYVWYEELENQNISSIAIDADEGDFFYNKNEIAVIEAPINQLKDDE